MMKLRRWSTPAGHGSCWAAPISPAAPWALISLYVDNGTPYVAYWGANAKAAVMEYTSGSRQLLGNPELSSGMASFESLFVYNGTPYVAYRDNANDS